MTQTIESITERLNELDNLIKETKARLPAHSTKPPVMMELLSYEDEYQELMDQLSKLKQAE